MDPMLDRRQFAIAAGAFASAMFLPRSARTDSPSLTLKRLLRLGINALARAPEMNYFADGHRGAALISAHMMCDDNHFNEAATNRIVELFDLSWAPSKLCRPFPDGDPVDDAVKRVGQTLAAGGGTLREVGHDAIFAMHAIKAFRMLPETATRERVDGVCRLIGSIKPWRDIPPDDSIAPPPFSDSKAAAKFILQEASNAIDRFVGFGQGFAGHMLTFGQSLVELAATGGEEWAESCRTAFRKYVTVTRKGPQGDDKKVKDHAVSQLRPKDAEYWHRRENTSLGIGHVFKYPYAYYNLLGRAQDAALEKELDAKIWQLF